MRSSSCLHLSGERGHPLCGSYSRKTVHVSKAQRDDCPRCRALYREEVKGCRAPAAVVPCRHEKTVKYEACECGAARKLPDGEWHAYVHEVRP